MFFPYHTHLFNNVCSTTRHTWLEHLKASLMSPYIGLGYVPCIILGYSQVFLSRHLQHDRFSAKKTTCRIELHMRHIVCRIFTYTTLHEMSYIVALLPHIWVVEGRIKSHSCNRISPEFHLNFLLGVIHK